MIATSFAPTQRVIRFPRSSFLDNGIPAISILVLQCSVSPFGFYRGVPTALAVPGCTIDNVLGPTRRAQQSHHHEQRLSTRPAPGCVAPVNKANGLESSNTQPTGGMEDLELLLINIP
jgi:hypothetical protein